MKKLLNSALALLFIGTLFGQTLPETINNRAKLARWVRTGTFTFTNKTLTSPTITGPGISGTISITGTSYLNLGSSGTPLAITTTPSFTVYSTSASVSGTVRTAIIDHTHTGAGAAVLEALRVNIDSEVRTGSWANAIVGRINYGTAGDAAGGMAAAICAEMNLPGRNVSGIGGSYHALDLEMNAPENYVANSGNAYPVSFLRFGIWGNGTAVASFEDNGFILQFADFTAAAGNVLSATSQTLRVLVGSTDRYLVLSQTEDGLGLGTSGSPQSVTYNGTKPLSIYTTCASTDGGDSYEPVLINTVMTGAGQVGGRMRVNMETNVALGAWSNALKGQVTYGAAGKTTGMGSAVCAEMTLSAGTTEGNYAPLELELNMGSAGVTGTRTGLMYMSVNDAKATTFDDLGYLFILNGLTAGTSGSDAFETSASVDANEITAGLRVSLDGVEYYLLMCTPTDIQD